MSVCGPPVHCKSVKRTKMCNFSLKSFKLLKYRIFRNNFYRIVILISLPNFWYLKDQNFSEFSLPLLNNGVVRCLMWLIKDNCFWEKIILSFITNSIHDQSINLCPCLFQPDIIQLSVFSISASLSCTVLSFKIFWK